MWNGCMNGFSPYSISCSNKGYSQYFHESCGSFYIWKIRCSRVKREASSRILCFKSFQLWWLMERLWAIGLGRFRTETKFPHCWRNKDLPGQAEGSQRRRGSVCWYCGPLRSASLCLPFTGKPGGEAEGYTTGSSQGPDVVVEGTYALILKQCLRWWQRNVLKLYQDKEALDMQAECSRLSKARDYRVIPKRQKQLKASQAWRSLGVRDEGWGSRHPHVLVIERRYFRICQYRQGPKPDTTSTF